MKRFYVFALIVGFSLQLDAQRLVSAVLLDTIIPAMDIPIPGLNPSFEVANWKLQYLTLSPEGEEHVASGLVSVPITNTPEVFPLACFQHGTVEGRDNVPSNLEGGHLLGGAFATNGYVVAAPDYIGLGDSPGIHPYVHAESEASASVDMLLATREFIADLDNVTLNQQLFISGYSQGGHAAMALQQEIETNQSDLFTVTASAPMSGPYSISESMVDFTLGDDEYMTVDYIAWLTLGYGRAYPTLLADFPVENVFRPEYIDDINEFRDEEITRSTLNQRMVATLRADGGLVLPKNTLQDDILDGILNDPMHPLSQALELNDTYNFTTETPTNLYYCQGDDQVTFENALLAEERMTANGSTNVQAIRLDSNIIPLNHVGCVLPASLRALGFFNSLKETESSVNNIQFSENVSVTHYDRQLTINMDEPNLRTAYMDIHNVSGQRVHTQQISSGVTYMTMPVSTSGQYFVTIYTNEQLLNVTPVINP